MRDLSAILQRARDGDGAAADELFTALYEELRSLARRQIASERGDHTLQPTALVHEAWLRLDRDGASYADRVQFLGAAASAIRRVLVDHARSRARLKRGGDRRREAGVEIDQIGAVRDEAWIALDDALRELGEAAPTTARIVELRFFAGMTIPEVAGSLGVSESTIEREWRVARAWLQCELGDDHGS